MAQRKKQKALDKINDIIKWTSDAGSIKSQTICINRSCTVYGIINELMDKNQLRYLDRSECFCGEDGEWIIQMSEQIKAHWDKERTFQEKHLENVKMNL